MRRVKSVVALCALVAGAAGTVAVAVGPAGAAVSKPVVVVAHLNNPRQLALVGNDELLIAEAGKGGTTKVGSGEEAMYIGATGSISAVLLPQYAHSTQPIRIVKGLMSGAGSPDGSFAVGSDGVSSRAPHGRIYIQETYAPADVLPAPFATKQDGRLLTTNPYGSYFHVVANISAYEKAHDPDHKGFDSDPYAVLVRAHDELVADAAGNDVLRIDGNGVIHTFHVFPNVRTGACASQYDPSPSFPGCNFVPTSLAVDRYGAVYVGGLAGEAPGQGRVVKLSSDGKHVLRTWTGFTSVTGVAIDRSGHLYVSQLEAKEAHPVSPQVVGVLTRVYQGHRINVDVPFPAGVAVNSYGVVFVAAWSVAPATGLAGPGTSGQVWRMRF